MTLVAGHPRAAAPDRGHAWRTATAAFGRVVATPQGAIGATIVAVVILVAIFAPLIAPYSPTAIAVRDRLADPSLAHLLGTDQLGRDLLSRVLVGTRTAIAVALLSILASLALALVLGLVAGYGPRWLDAVLVLVFDSLSSVPMIMFALALVVVMGPGIGTVVLVIVVYSVPSYARMVRAQTLALKGRDFVKAAEAMNARTGRILFHHLMPNVVGPLLILACLDISTVITLEAGLSFLGLGVKPQLPSWGNILAEGFSMIRVTPLPVIVGGAPLVIATIGFTFFGEALRDALDPKLARDRLP